MIGGCHPWKGGIQKYHPPLLSLVSECCQVHPSPIKLHVLSAWLAHLWQFIKSDWWWMAMLLPWVRLKSTSQCPLHGSFGQLLQWTKFHLSVAGLYMWTAASVWVQTLVDKLHQLPREESTNSICLLYWWTQLFCTYFWLGHRCTGCLSESLKWQRLIGPRDRLVVEIRTVSHSLSRRNLGGI